MFVLPQILLVGDRIIELTAFVMKMPLQSINRRGSMRIDGAIRGHIDGEITGVIHANVRGNVSAFIQNEDIDMLEEETKGKGAD